MNKITLYVVTHKDFLEKIVDRTVIGVGVNKKIEGADLYDNTGDNFYTEIIS